MKKILLVVVTASSLVGCEEDSISVIQKQFVKGSETYTYKELFENRKICGKETWTDTLVDEVKGVKYVCQINLDGLKATYSKKEEQEVRNVAEVEYYASLNKNHKEKLDAINNDKSIENPQDKIKEENDNYAKAMDELSELAKKQIEEKVEEYREGSIRDITETISWEWSGLDKEYHIKELKMIFNNGVGKEISADICLENIIYAVANNYTTPEKYLSYFIMATPRCALK